MTETFVNGASQTDLNGAINNSVTSLDVDDASVFPTVGNFRIRIDNELMLVTGVSSNTLTVTRAIEGTSAASHSDEATVDFELTAAALIQIRLDALSSDPALYTLMGGL